MYTQESFCNAVWGTTFIKIDGSYSKDDYKDFSIPKKGGIRNLSYLPKSSALYALQTKLLHCFLAKISLPTIRFSFSQSLKNSFFKIFRQFEHNRRYLIVKEP